MDAAAYGARREWAEQVPRLLAVCAQRWGLSEMRSLEGGYVSHVFACTDAQGSQLVLKVSAPVLQPEIEAAALRAWAGEGAVRLLDFDPDSGAMLLERLEPGTELPPADEPGALKVAAHILRLLHSHGLPATPAFPEFDEAFGSWLVRVRADAEPGTLGTTLLDQATNTAAELNATRHESVLLHGDFVDKNILLSDRGYVAIDPMPRIGDPCEDIGFFVAYHRPARLIEWRARALAAALGRPPDRVLRWTAVWAVGEGCETWRSDTDELQYWLSTRATTLLA